MIIYNYKKEGVRMTRIEMEEALQQYYEAKGFTNYYETVLKNKADKEIEEMYQEIFEVEDEN